MLPLIRLLVIGIKMCTEPIIGHIKNIAQVKAAGRVRFFLIKAGGRIHIYENSINRKFLGLKDQSEIEELSEEEAIQKACSFFLEVFVLYGIFFYWAITETLDSMESSRQLKKDLDNLKESNENLKIDFKEFIKNKERVDREFLDIKNDIIENKLATEIKENDLKEIIKYLTQRIVVLEEKNK